MGPFAAILGVAKFLGGIDIGGAVKSVTHTFEVNAQTKSNTAIAQIGANKDVAIVDTTTRAEIARENIRADMDATRIQGQIAQADRTDAKSAWMRPAGFGVCFFYFTCLILEHTMPRLAKLLWIEVRVLPSPWDWLVLAIMCAVYALRTIDKKFSAETRASIITANVAAKGKGLP